MTTFSPESGSASAASITLNVVQAAPVINWPTPAAIPYGTALSAAQLNASAGYNGISVPGTFDYTPASGEVLDSGSQQLLVSFSPADSTDYASASGSVSLVVNPNSGLPPATIYSYSIANASGGSGYAPNGNILSYTDSVTGTWNFSYDSLNRLATAASGANAPAPYANNYGCWAYDDFGNRLSQSMSTTPCTGEPPLMSWALYTVDGTPNTPDNGRNQIKGTANGIYLYDAAGDVTYDGNNSYLYDAEGRICAVKSQPVNGTYAMTGYIYDAEGTRVAKGNLTQFTCDTNPADTATYNGFNPTNAYVLDPGGEQLTETDGSGNWIHTNVYAAGQLIATYTQSSGTQPLYFQLADWLGTKRVQTDYQGNNPEYCSSLAFGDNLVCSGTTDATEHHFTGKERDAESGNDYFGARYYASTMGRWMSPDWGKGPVPYATFTDPQSLNLYAYVRNNPLNRTDPNGHWCLGGVGNTCSQASHDHAVNVGIGILKGLGTAAINSYKTSAALVVGPAALLIPGPKALHPSNSTQAVASTVTQVVTTAVSALAAGPIAGMAGATDSVVNAVPATVARAIPASIEATTFAAPGASDAFVTSGGALNGMTSRGISEALTIPESPSGFNVYEFPTPEGIASPINRVDPGFVGGGQTGGGLPEFVVPNGPIPANATSTFVPPGE